MRGQANTLWRGGFWLGIALSAGGVAHAETGWQLCNQTSYIIKAAIGRPEPEGVKTRGWLRVQPGACRAASPAPLVHADHYVYAQASAAYSGGLRLWAGARSFCIGQQGPFAIRQPDPCTQAGREKAPFIVVPVKQSAKTTWLSEARDYTLKQAQAAGIQRLLKDAGVVELEINGQLGARARQSIQDFLHRRGLPEQIADTDLIDVLEKAALKRVSNFGMDVCNRTPARLWTAIGLRRDEIWESRGWWPIESGQCARVINRALQNQPYYVFAQMEVSGAGMGIGLRGRNRVFCIARSKFVIMGADNCRSRHYDEAGFIVTQTPETGHLEIEFTQADFESARGEAG